MSLIDEALRRAQLARRPGDAPGSDSLNPWAAAPLPDARQARRRIGPVTAVLVAVLAAGGGFALFRGSHGNRVRKAIVASPTPRRGPTSPPPPGQSEAIAAALPARRSSERMPPSAPSQPAVTAGPLAPVSAGAKPARPDLAGSPTRPQADASLASPARPAPVIYVRSASSSPAIPAPIAAAPPPPRPHAPAAAPERERGVHVGEVTVPGGHIELGGIVYSEANPVALLNGRIVGVGGVVEGFTVISIEESRVELKNEHRTLVLTLR